jgi:hypothetical protein
VSAPAKLIYHIHVDVGPLCQNLYPLHVLLSTSDMKQRFALAVAIIDRTATVDQGVDHRFCA